MKLENGNVVDASVTTYAQYIPAAKFAVLTEEVHKIEIPEIVTSPICSNYTLKIME